MYIQAVPYSLLLRMYMFLDNQFMKLHNNNNVLPMATGLYTTPSNRRLVRRGVAGSMDWYTQVSKREKVGGYFKCPVVVQVFNSVIAPRAREACWPRKYETTN